MSRDKMGFTALHLGAATGGLELCQVLLAARVPVDTRDNDDSTPLHLACGSILCEVYEVGKDEAGEPKETPEAEQLAIVSLLLDAGADRRAHNRKGRTPVDYATSRGWSQIVDMMIRQDKEAAVSRSSEW